jgi:adenosylcobinamide-phosphate synthase
LYIVCAAVLGFLLDLAFGDPRGWPHPVVGIGRLIGALERILRARLRKTRRGELWGGAALLVLTAGVSFAAPFGALLLARRVSVWLWFGLEAWLCYRMLAARSLAAAGSRVRADLARGDLDAARVSVSMIVGRDTAGLDGSGVARAAVETVAENTTDGVVSPLFYMLLGGAPLLFLFKAVSTLDSMVGYQNEKYRYFGRFSARADDVLGFVPARIAGVLMVAAAFLAGLDGRGALRIFRRDRGNTPSSNSGQTEAACAGALGIQLGGGAYYGGVYHEKRTLGDAAREPAARELRAANRLLYATSILALTLFCAVRTGIVLWV